MKMLPLYYTKNPDTVNAYQDNDLMLLRDLFTEAETLWMDEWQAQGSVDDGTCCGGKGIRLRYAGPRKRTAEWLTVIDSPPCQGNLSASRSVAPALAFLKAHNVEAVYYDGWMD